MRATARQIGGRTAMRAGDGFEKWLARMHRFYLRQGVADIHKLPVDTFPTGRSDRQGRPLRSLKTRQRYDYCGTLLAATGRPGLLIAVEAKAIGFGNAAAKPAASMAVVEPKGTGFGIKRHQLDALVAQHEHGAAAAIVWHNAGDLLVLSGSLLLDIKDHKRIPRDAFKACDDGDYLRVVVNRMDEEGTPTWST